MRVEEWKAEYGHRATGGAEWTGSARIAAAADRTAEIMLAVRPGPVGPDNAVLLHGSMWSRLELSGGPREFVGRFGPSSTVLVEIDPVQRMLALQGRLGWRIETRLEPFGGETRVIRRVRHLSASKRFFVPVLQFFQVRADARRLELAVHLFEWGGEARTT